MNIKTLALQSTFFSLLLLCDASFNHEAKAVNFFGKNYCNYKHTDTVIATGEVLFTNVQYRLFLTAYTCDDPSFLHSVNPHTVEQLEEADDYDLTDKVYMGTNEYISHHNGITNDGSIECRVELYSIPQILL